jgi:hypothetical protein
MLRRCFVFVLVVFDEAIAHVFARGEQHRG